MCRSDIVYALQEFTRPFISTSIFNQASLPQIIGMGEIIKGLLPSFPPPLTMKCKGKPSLVPRPSPHETNYRKHKKNKLQKAGRGLVDFITCATSG